MITFAVWPLRADGLRAQFYARTVYFFSCSAAVISMSISSFTR
jgi:hypothetical protein